MGDLTTGAKREVEEFIMQGKSSLDILVKIFEPLFGVKLHTYGEGGVKVINALRNNIKDCEASRTQHLIELIEGDQKWIEHWFGDQRDTITHYRAIASSGFLGIPDRDGFLHYQVPRTQEGISFEELVQVLYHNLLTFCEDFFALAVSIKFYPAIGLCVLPEEQRDKEYPRKYGTFLTLVAQEPHTA